MRIYDLKRHRRLVAAIETVSPASKDRPENRRAIITKCAGLLQEQVSVTIVDLVTTRQFNLFGELMEQVGPTWPDFEREDTIYAVECRFIFREDRGQLETWEEPLRIDQPLPTLPLWLAADFSIPLNLEESYEETCRVLRLP